MMMDTKFEIKLALIGYVSVGKTTVLNALLRDKYGGVAMGRATASVNNYCVVSTTTKQSSAEPVVGSSASEILKKTTKENARLRGSDTVEEAWFEITLDKPLFDMRDDTNLVVVDIPGINEAGTSSKYKDFVVNHWHTFDCVVVVMDGRQGVNTEEQVDLLKFVKSNCDKTKGVPVIVLCNKIEDPDEGEQAALIAETQQAVQKIFQTKDLQKTLSETLKAASETRDRGTAPFPPIVLLPVSAIHAFMYQAGSRCGFDQIQRFFDKDLIEKLGKEHFGKKWRRFSTQQKLEKAYEVLSDRAQCEEGFDLSHFDKFVALLSFCIGGRETQRSILKSQIDVALTRLSPQLVVNVANEFQTFYTRSKALNQPVEGLPTHFWSLFDQVADNSFSLVKGPKDIRFVSSPMDLLFKYAQFLHEVEWESEKESVLKHAKNLVKRHITLVVDQFDHGHQASPPQLVLLYGALLLQSHEAFFYQSFGLLKIIMEDRARAASARCESSDKCVASDCSGKMEALPGHFIQIWRCTDCNRYATEWGSKFCPSSYMSAVHTPKTMNGHSFGNRLHTQCNRCSAQTLKSDIEGLEKCDNCALELQTKCIGTSTVKHCGTCNHWYASTSMKNVCVDSIANHSFEGNVDVLSYHYGPFPRYDLMDEEAGSSSATNLTIPDSLEDPEHAGHLIWTYGRIVKLFGME
jgi:GTPase SAR1 family protein